MKLEVQDKGSIEADTIGSLKASIMALFSLSAEDLSQKRLLVRDNRDLVLNMNPITGCVDLLQLADEFILDSCGDLCKDGDTLVLGWKGPFTLRLVTDFMLGEGYDIKVSNSFTLRQLKRWIKRVTRESVTEKNLPRVLIDGDDDKPLLFFGYYRFWRYMQANGVTIDIHRSADSTPVSIYPVTTWVKRDANGNECLVPVQGPVRVGPLPDYKKDMKNEKRKIESKEIIEENQKKNQKKKNKNNNNNNSKARIIQSKENIEENQKKNQKKKNKNNNNNNNSKARIIQA